MKRVYLKGYPFRIRRHVFPVIVWLGAVLCVIGLFTRRSQRFEVLGMARGQVRQISATSTGRLTEVCVDLFEQVEAGQTLAVIDTVLDDDNMVEADLRSQLNAAVAEIEHLTAQLVPTQDALLADKADREINFATELRRFLIDADQSRLEILSLKAQIASDRVLLADLASDVKITEALLKEDAVVPYELQKVKAQHDSLAKKISENEMMLAQVEKDYVTAKQRLDDFSQLQLTHPSIDNALEVIRKEIKVQEEVVNGIVQQLEALNARRVVELKAPFAGVVISLQGRANQAILRRPGEDVIRRTGEVIQAGESILSVAENRPSEIIAYVSESQLGLVDERTQVEVFKSRPPEQKARCEVKYIGPTLELMPEQLWRNPNFPQWGQPIVIKIPEGLELIAGELVGIRAL
ncbi:MAG: HlyD family efflux transporter periplasmic adaptor subunit [Sedimentisphaerales bacterium]|nr:HlyD family efflux transporter periplasmic adaptor subunit [Sedimentisphaerales bacterium]